MATVFLARLSGVGGFQRFVAIKRLHPHLAREPEFIEMFLEEARLAARIHHPNVVPILEIGETEHGYYIVMEYVEGDTLGRLLARSAQTGQRLPTKVGLRVIVDMLAGLDAAHELKDDEANPLGIVHRDISPQNVLVGVDGSARLSDFGVARATSRLSTTRTGQLKGKLAYMAPEQARGDRDIDRRADLFAAGIVLWEVLACRRLFKGDGEADTLNRVMNEPIPPVRSMAPMVPAALEAVVARALERERSKRYTTAAEFADALERASRVVGALGTHKDVAAHLENVLGTEISQQRETVRAWLSRSEPSKHGVDVLPRPEATAVTRVDGRDGSTSSVSKVSAMTRVPSVPNQAGSGSVPSIPRTPTPSAPSVPSVASAVISTHPSPSADIVAPPLLPIVVHSRRTSAWPWVLVVMMALAGGVVWLQFGRGAGAAAVPAAGPGASVAVTPSAAPSTAPVPAPPLASASASATAALPEPPAPAVPTHASAVAPWRPGHAAPPPATARETATAVPVPTPAPTPPAPTATAAPVPDDISRNPYR
jgi:serine/threonine protein kinase